MLKIIPGSEEIKPDLLIAVIYGDAGLGKSSLGFTGMNPLMLDFDHGAHRSEFRKDIVLVNRWEEVATMERSDFHNYDTVIIDTVGRALDMVSSSLIGTNAKLSTAQGALTLQGYGALKSTFIQWLTRLRGFGLDIILLAHSKEDRKQDDTLFYRPEVTGGSASEIYKVADLLAYYHYRDNRRTLEFAPSDAWVGKDPAGFGTVYVDNFHDNGSYLAELVARAKEKLGNISKESIQIAAKVSEIAEEVLAAKNADALNEMMPKLHEVEIPVKRQVWGLMQSHAKSMDLKFDRESKLFIPIPKEAPPAETESTDTEKPTDTESADAVKPAENDQDKPAETASTEKPSLGDEIQTVSEATGDEKKASIQPQRGTRKKRASKKSGG